MKHYFIIFFSLPLSLLCAEVSSGPTPIRQSSIYDYPAGFEETYNKPSFIDPPASISSFVERPTAAQ